MSLTPDEFHMRHGDAIRESLMMLDGHDGAFQLLAHCFLRIGDGKQERAFAVVRSTATNCAYFLVQQSGGDFPRDERWHAMSPEERQLLRRQLDSMTDAARGYARGLLAARS